MASKYSSLTPYNYAMNDPVYWNDPFGDDVWSSWDDIFQWVEASLQAEGSGGAYWDSGGTQFSFYGDIAVNGAFAGYNSYHTGGYGFELVTTGISSMQSDGGAYVTREWQPVQNYGNDQVRFHHVSPQEKVDALFGYFDELHSTGRTSGNLDDVFDFNYYVERTWLDKLFSGDWETQERISNAWTAKGQGLIKPFKGEIDIDGQKVKVEIAIPKAFNVRRQGLRKDELGFYFDDDPIDITHGNLTYNYVHSWKLRQDPNSGARPFQIMINFSRLSDKQLFFDHYLDPGSKPNKLKLDLYDY